MVMSTGDWKLPFLRFASPRARLSFSGLTSSNPDKRKRPPSPLSGPLDNDEADLLLPTAMSRQSTGRLKKGSSREEEGMTRPNTLRRRSISQSTLFSGGGAEDEAPHPLLPLAAAQTWSRAYLTLESSTEGAVSPPFANDLCSSVSSCSLTSKSRHCPDSAELTLLSTTDTPLAEEEESAQTARTHVCRRRPRVRLNERASRVAVSPQHGGRFLDPVSMMGLVQRQHQMCASARRSEDLASLASHPSLRMAERSSSHSCAKSQSLRAHGDVLLKQRGLSVEGRRSTVDPRMSGGRRSYPSALHAPPRGAPASERRSGSMGRASRPRDANSAPLSSRTAPVSFRKRQLVTDSYTPLNQDALWLAVRNRQYSRRHNSSTKLAPPDLLGDGNLFFDEADSFGMWSTP